MFTRENIPKYRDTCIWRVPFPVALNTHTHMNVNIYNLCNFQIILSHLPYYTMNLFGMHDFNLSHLTLECVTRSLFFAVASFQKKTLLYLVHVANKIVNIFLKRGIFAPHSLLITCTFCKYLCGLIPCIHSLCSHELGYWFFSPIF